MPAIYPLAGSAPTLSSGLLPAFIEVNDNHEVVNPLSQVAVRQSLLRHRPKLQLQVILL